MKCPNCNKEMKSEVYLFYDNIKYGKEYVCEDCRIKNNIFGWSLPKELAPTEKQIKTVLFIKNRLKLDTSNLVVKKNYWNFIKEYFDKARNTSSCRHFLWRRSKGRLENVPDEWDYDIPEEF